MSSRGNIEAIYPHCSGLSGLTAQSRLESLLDDRLDRFGLEDVGAVGQDLVEERPRAGQVDGRDALVFLNICKAHDRRLAIAQCADPPGWPTSGACRIGTAAAARRRRHSGRRSQRRPRPNEETMKGAWWLLRWKMATASLCGTAARGRTMRRSHIFRRSCTIRGLLPGLQTGELVN